MAKLADVMSSKATVIGLTLAAVLLTTRFGGMFGFPPSGISTFWPPNAILAAALVLLQPRERRICLALSYPAYVVAEIWIGFGAFQSLAFALANCVEAALACWLMVRPGQTGRIEWTIRYATRMLMAFLVSSCVGALIGALAVSVGDGPFGETFARWMLADFVGFLIFAPLVLTLPEWGRWFGQATGRMWTELLVSVALVALTSDLAYGPPIFSMKDFLGDLFLPIPVILWMALRGGVAVASLGLLIATITALTYAINGHGFYTGLEAGSSVLSLQVFTISIVIATQLVAILSLERNAALKALNKADRDQRQARYKAIVDNANDAIVILDAETGKYIDANPSAARLFGRTITDLADHYGPLDFSPETQPDGQNSRDAIEQHILAARRGEVVSFEWTFIAADGREVCVAAELGRFPDPERLLVRGSYIDITERKQAERERKELEQRLAQSQKLEAIGLLTGGVAHDFNNLLNITLGSLEMLRIPADQPEQRRLVDTAIKATLKGGELTSKMLAFGRRAFLEPTKLDLNKTIREMDIWMSRTIPANIRVEINLAEDICPIEADLASTESAILNLIINAREAMADGGVLTIETSSATIGHDEAGDGLECGDYVMVSVRDTGVGISPDDISRVFDPFFTTRAFGKGSGLGLSMVHGFMRQSNGGVRIQSELGKGTVVRLYFKPYRARPERTTPPLGLAVPAQRKSAHILLVEDQIEVNELMYRFLTDDGHSVISVLTGDEALNRYRTDGPFDLLVTDIVLPGALQGPELIEQLRLRDPQLPIVVVSGYARSAADEGGRSYKSSIRLVKPVTRRQLLDAVQASLVNR